MKLLLATTAAIVLFTGMAHADDGSGVSRGTSAVVIPTPSGVPYIMPFVSDRTAQRNRPRNNFQPGPFREGNLK